jgi:hypothetical protein
MFKKYNQEYINSYNHGKDGLFVEQINHLKNKILEIETRIQFSEITKKDELDLEFFQQQIDLITEEDMFEWMEIDPEYDEFLDKFKNDPSEDKSNSIYDRLKSWLKKIRIS